MRTVPRGLLALAGLVAGGFGLAVAAGTTTLLHARATPVDAVAETVVELTPGPVAETLIHLVGRYDKPLLVAGVTLAVLALGAWAGVLAGRSRALANVVVTGSALLALAAVVSRPRFAPVDVLPTVVGALAWVAALGSMTLALGAGTRAASEPSGPPPDRSAEPDRADRVSTPTRRAFLSRAAGFTAAAVVVGVGGRLLGRARRSVEAARTALRLPVTRGVVPAGADLGVPGITPWRVDDTAFYRIDTALVLPSVDPADWRLRIHGMVDRELEIGFDDLLRRRRTEAWVTLCCVSNPVGGDLVGNAWWSGVRVAELLAEAGVSPDADAVLQTSQDGWTCGTPLTALTDDRNALLAVAMNGEPLPVEHGFPVRMVVPGLYGYVSATKWVVDLEVTRFDRFTAYWTERGWSARGPVKTESRVDVPRGGQRVPAGTVRVGGSAWAQHTGIARVEYRLDGGPWRRARLGAVPDLDTWVQWTGTVQVGPGDHTLAVRATDRSGYTQTPVRRDVVPDGATGWHTVDFTAVQA